MKDSLFILSFEKWFKAGYSIAQAIEFAARHGFEAVELYPVAELASPDIEAAKHIAELCAKHKLSVSCFSMTADLSQDDARPSIENVKRYVDVAQTLNAKLFHHTIAPSLAYDRSHMPSYRELKGLALERCREICDYAAQRGLICAYEEQGLVFNGIAAFGDFYASLDAQNKGVVADFGNILFSGDDPVRFVAAFLGDIVHVHAKDYLYKSSGPMLKDWYVTKNCDMLRGTVIGHGVVPITQILKIINSSGYDGCYSIEFDGMEDPEEAVLQGRDNMHRLMIEASRQMTTML